MKKAAIAEIKQQLNDINDLHDPYVLNLQTDSRKGVQQLLVQLERRIAKKQKLVTQYQLMQHYERQCRIDGHTLVAGIDEVGRGPLAGPVVAAAVILAEDTVILGLNDSKQLNEKKRGLLAGEIQKQALAIGIAQVAPAEIDRLNIYQASRLAMKEAVEQLQLVPQHLLIDAMQIDLDIPQEKIIKGDAKSVSIAAASIIAKVYRDNLMKEYHKKYPYYAFDKNAGYGTKDHLQGIKKHGITPIHRKTFAPIKNLI